MTDYTGSKAKRDVQATVLLDESDRLRKALDIKHKALDIAEEIADSNRAEIKRLKIKLNQWEKKDILIHARAVVTIGTCGYYVHEDVKWEIEKLRGILERQIY